MSKLCLLLLFGFVAIICRAQTPKNATILGVEKQIYTDSLPHSPTRTYYVADNITLSGNIRLQNIRFLFKSNFRRNQTVDLQQNKNIRKAGGTAYGTNIQLCGANVTLQNCTLAAADSGMWGGVYLADSSSVLQLNGCRISDSYNGIIQLTQNALKVENCTFRNNYVSLQLAGRRDTLRHNNFSSCTSAMKMPLDSVSLDEHFISQTHLKSTDGQELYLLSKQFENNLFDKAVVGIFVIEKHKLNIEHCVFGVCEIASLYARNGELNIIQTDFNLNRTLKNSSRNTPLPFAVPTAGQHFGIISDSGKVRLEEISMYEESPQSIGLHGFNSDIELKCSELSNLQTGLYLTGSQGQYSLQASRYENNTVGVWIHAPQARNIKLEHFEQNLFVSLPNLQGVYPSRTGLYLTGAAGTTVNNTNEQNTIGRCRWGQPNGNMVDIGQQLLTQTSTVFTFIQNDLDKPLEYCCHEEENSKAARNNNVLFVTTVDLLSDTYENERIICTNLGAKIRFSFSNLPHTPIFTLDKPRVKAKNMIQINYTIPLEAKHTFQLVIDAADSGEKVYEQNLLQHAGNLDVPINNWSSGIYNYSLIYNNQTLQTRKLFIIHH